MSAFCAYLNDLHEGRGLRCFPLLSLPKIPLEIPMLLNMVSNGADCSYFFTLEFLTFHCPFFRRSVHCAAFPALSAHRFSTEMSRSRNTILQSQCHNLRRIAANTKRTRDPGFTKLHLTAPAQFVRRLSGQASPEKSGGPCSADSLFAVWQRVYM